MPPDYFFAMPTRELNDFGEGFVGLVRLVAARTRSPRKSPDGDMCCPTSSVENFGWTTYHGPTVRLTLKSLNSVSAAAPEAIRPPLEGAYIDVLLEDGVTTLAECH